MITGAQGFVGRYLVSHLLSSSGTVQILGIGRSPFSTEFFTHSITMGVKRVQAPLPENLLEVLHSDRYEYKAVDIRDKDAMISVLRSFRPDVICHMASGLRDDSPDYLFRTNVEGTIKLMEAIADSDVSPAKLLLGSTGGVYGRPSAEELPLVEEARCRPVDIYSASKLAVEHVSAILARDFGIPTIWCRLFNLVGPGQDERHVCGKFASWLAALMRRELPPIIEVGSLHTTRDFLDIRDAARALQTIMEKGEPDRAYNIGTGQETTIGEVLTTLITLAGMQDVVRIKQVEERAEDIPRHFANIGRLQLLGFQQGFTLEKSLEDLLHYYNAISSRKAMAS